MTAVNGRRKGVFMVVTWQVVVFVIGWTIASERGEKLIIPSLDHLIALKLHAIKHNQRNRIWKDLPDIIRLIQMNNIDCKNEAFKEICLKYGNHEIYKIILKNCEK